MALTTTGRGTSRSGGAPSNIAATFMAHLLETGQLQRHISETLQPAYARRYHLMMSAIKQHLSPIGVTLAQADREVVGGYFIWLRLPPRITASLLARRAKDTQNLVVAEGALFEVPGDTEHTSFPHELRLCFAWEEEEKLTEGIVRLASLIDEMQNEREGIRGWTRKASAEDQDRKEDQSAFW
jgi:DNA-binding transcriptional MocR family regulator